MQCCCRTWRHLKKLYWLCAKVLVFLPHSFNPYLPQQKLFRRTKQPHSRHSVSNCSCNLLLLISYCFKTTVKMFRNAIRQSSRSVSAISVTSKAAVVSSTHHWPRAQSSFELFLYSMSCAMCCIKQISNFHSVMVVEC